MSSTSKCLLMILDGWGVGNKDEGDAVFSANTPCLDSLIKNYPTSQLMCFGEHVGLSDGIMGNSEVGHMNIGAGRVVFQNLLKIDRAVAAKTFDKNPALGGVISKVKENGTALHLLGLVSDGGVHSQLTHLYALIDMAEKMEISTVNIHVILDGRDTPPDSGVKYVQMLEDYIEDKPGIRIASLCGRFYAMDRDTRWDRTEKAYRLYTEACGDIIGDAFDALNASYARNEFDEFVKPVAIAADGENPAVVEAGDGVIFFNFRADRAREITRAFNDKEFIGFERKVHPETAAFVCMTDYDETFDLPVAFGKEIPGQMLGQVVSDQGLNQLRIAETEKYAHVTYFFNGGEESPFENEDRVLIPSPREVATYDEKPSMSAMEVADELIDRIKQDKYHLVVVNFANMDMVGHTGIPVAAREACEVVDKCVERVLAEAKDHGFKVLVTADHGNAEKMKAEDGNPHTSHTLNPVSIVLVDDENSEVSMENGKLADIAPTVLEIMGIEQPGVMTGRSLIVKK